MERAKNASTYKEVEAYIYDIPKFTKKNGLDNTRLLLEALGNPGMEKEIIHVAGTNGKGSVCNFLNNLLMETGKKTGLFISPHLETMCERMQIDGEMITDEEFVAAFHKVMDVVEEVTKDSSIAHPTFFELLFLMAMVMFEEKEVDCIVLETGLGGKKDATNVVMPKCTVITKIGLDHCQYLGDTKQAIAGEKAGIIKPGVPVIYLAEQEESSAVIEEKAEQMGALLCPVDKNTYHVEKSNHKKVDFSFHSMYYNYVDFAVSMPAVYQAENASLALKCFEVFMEGRGYTAEQMQKAIARMRFAGRMEELSRGIFVDGAHNPDGVEAFITSVRQHETEGRRILMFGAVDDKDYDKMCLELLESGLFSEVVLTGMDEKRAVKVSELQKIFSGYTELVPYIADGVEDALSRAFRLKGEKDTLYIVGSLYLAGFVKTAFRRN